LASPTDRVYSTAPGQAADFYTTQNKYCYLLNEHLFGVCTPRDDKLCTAVRQAFPCDLDKELEVTRPALELLQFGEGDGARQVGNEAVKNAHIFIASQLARSCTLQTTLMAS